MADVRYALYNDICRNIIILMHYFWTKRRAFKEKSWGIRYCSFFCKKNLCTKYHTFCFLCRRLVYKKSLTFVNLSILFERKFKVFQRFVAIAANSMQDTAFCLSDKMIDELIQMLRIEKWILGVMQIISFRTCLIVYIQSTRNCIRENDERWSI